MNAAEAWDKMIEGASECEEGSGEPAAPVGAIRPTKLRYSHEAVIDMIIAKPGISQNTMAAMFGYTPGWLSTVMGSDAFKARLAERREEIVDPALKMGLEERFRAMTEKSLEVLQAKLSEANVGSIPDNLVLRAAELGAKALGIGGNAPPAPAAIPLDHLEGLAGRLMALQSRVQAGSGQTLEGQATLIGSGEA